MTEIKGTTRVCGLIGNPVGHSVSPLIHNTLADLMNINMVYTTFKVEKDNVSDAVKGAFALDILGLNVTVPHKQNVMESLVSIDPVAKAIGAVNTLVRCESGYKGYNTDILGLKRELEEEKILLKGNKCIILGAGGAARAIAFLCVQEGAECVYIVNRTIDKAKNIAEAVNAYYNTDCVKALELSSYMDIPGEGYIAIQTTSVGLYPNFDDVVISDSKFYDKISVGVDIIYNPYETRFMKCLKEQSKPAYNGLKMLLYQGISAFELWNNVSVSKEYADKVYDRLREAL